jgi:hypothetical protein
MYGAIINIFVLRFSALKENNNLCRFFEEIYFGFYEQMVYVKQARKTSVRNERKGFGGKWWWPIAEIKQNFIRRDWGKTQNAC